jgi:hypothetical protein
MDAREELDVFVDGQIAVEREALRHVADARGGLPRLAKWIGAKDSYRSAVGRQQSTDGAHRGRFAGAVRADDAEHLARVHIERHAIQGDRGVELFTQAFDGDYGRHGLNEPSDPDRLPPACRASARPCCCRRRP